VATTELSHVIAKQPTRRNRLALLTLLYLHIAVCCVSLLYVSYYYSGYNLLKYDATQLYPSMLNVAPLALLAVVFVLSRFSFGYFLGLNFFTIIVGYVWLSRFSLLGYDHRLGIVSALLALSAFLAPALFLTRPIRQWAVLSEAALERLLLLVMVLAIFVIAVGMFYNFRIVGLADIYKFRLSIDFPTPLKYAIGIFSTALPYVFACYVMRGNPWRAVAALLLLLLFYPITLTKVALFSPFWLLFLALLAAYFEARIAVVLSLLLAVMLGVTLALIAARGIIPQDRFIEYYFGPVNFRMIAVPSIVLDMYSDFFSKHDLTYFCQISYLKPFVTCPYGDSLQDIMFNHYSMGYANGSLFATEGVASVGLKWAPLSALVCGLVVALGNGLSSGLPPKFILLSAGVASQVLMNVPLSTSLLSDGVAVLFLLWYVTPRKAFESKLQREFAAPAHQSD
jgi:hypothetical protein